MTTTRKTFDLTGRRILIAGAAGGIGSATARLCAEQGATVVLADIAGEAAIREKVGPVAAKAEIHVFDTSQRQQVEAAASRIGPVYALIDTSGVAPMDDWMAEDWERSLELVINVNIKGPINLTRAFLPPMLAAREGRIVLCGSVAGWMGGVRSGPHYAFSKGGMHAFVRWLSRQGVAHNVMVNGIAPGPVLTGMTEGKGYDPSQYPTQRMGRPEEVASAAAFLCSEGASYMSGAIVDVNGGVYFH